MLALAAPRRPAQPRRLESLRRRDFLIGAAATSAFLAGCGSPASTDPAPEAGSRSVAHAHGETVISGTPQRVVSVGLTDQDVLLALGIEPVAAKAWYKDQIIFPWTASDRERATKVMPTGEIDFEAVAAYQPDLIVGVSSGLTKEQYDKLSKLAPTIAQAADAGEGATAWPTQALMIGRAVGKEEEASRLNAETDRLYAEAAARHPEWKGAQAVLASQVLEGQLLLYSSQSPAVSILTKLGFAIPAQVEQHFDKAYGGPTLSLENLEVIDVDLVVWDQSREALKPSGILDSPLFQRLNAAREGRIVFASQDIGDALAFGTVLSRRFALERLEPEIQAVLGR